MRYQTVMSDSVPTSKRLDCWYFLSPGNASAVLLQTAKSKGIQCRCLGGPGGFAELSKPARAKMSLAAAGEPAAPYLRPYDLFNYLPEPSDWLSVPRSEALDSFRLTPGMILQTCSGRNLGPSVIVDDYTAGFVIGGDMIRVVIRDPDSRAYAFGFLNSRCGRNLMRRDKTGSVIDHLDPRDLEKLEVPILPKPEYDKIVDLVTRASSLREQARLGLKKLLKKCEDGLASMVRSKPLRQGWALSSTIVEGRLDAAYYDPLVSSVRAALASMGGKRVKEFATVLKPAGRYKTCYVDRAHGRPLLGGAQLLQTMPINLQYMAPRTFKNISDYELRSGWIAYPADGRAEEELGTPVLVTPDRDGWLASGHVGRVVPNPGVDAGWLFLALWTIHSQIQLKARASGSVVDSTFPEDMEEVILPDPKGVDSSGVIGFWHNLAEAQTMQEQASSVFDAFLNSFAS